tara:strand:- start:1515 stop:1823 length:309 start_codon:yes stop_codon:yes gene_type:complete
MKRIKVSHIKEWLKTLEENKWRKTYDVDARRIAHFVNFGESVDLPQSLQKKSKNSSYIREAEMAKKYVKHIKEREKLKKNRNMMENFIRKQIRKIIRANGGR